jgi:hypothetical protein
MRSGKNALVIRRIPVEVDNTYSSTAVPGMAAQAASALNAALHGHFADDINPPRSAGLSFARELP